MDAISHIKDDAEPATEVRRKVERWFERQGVPHFSVRYPRRELRPLVLSILVIVLAFEVTVLAWLEFTVAVAAASLAYVAAMVLILLPFLRTAAEPWAVTNWPRVFGHLVLRVAGFAGLGTLLWVGAMPAVTFNNWVSFTLFVTLLLAAITFARGNPRSSLLRPRLVNWLTGVLAFVSVVIALQEWDRPRGLTLLVVAQFAAIVLLFLALIATEQPSRSGRGADALPWVLVVLAVELTILPAVAPPTWVYFLVIVVAYASMFWSDFVGTAPGKRTMRWLRARRRIFKPIGVVAIGIVFVGSLPAFVERTDFVQTIPHQISWLQALVLNAGALFLTLFLVLYGLDRILAWMTKEAVRDFRATLSAVVGSLPVVLLVLFFAGLATEIWQVATRPRTAAWAALLMAISAVAFIVALWGCMRELKSYCESLGQWPAVRKAIKASGDAELIRLVGDRGPTAGRAPAAQLETRPKINVVTVMMLYQVIYFTVVGVAMSVVFYGVGKLAVDDDTLQTWQVAVPDVRSKSWHVSTTDYTHWPFWDQPWTRLALLLGAFSALAFVAHVTAGDDERRRFFEGPDKGIKARLAARIVYRSQLLEDGEVSHGRSRARQAGARRLPRRSRGRDRESATKPTPAPAPPPTR